MKLLHLSVASVIGSAIGLALLLLLTLQGTREINAAKDQADTLFELRHRIDNLSVAADNLLLFGATAELWQRLRADAEAIERQLKQLGAEEPKALKAALRIRALSDALATLASPSASTATNAGAPPRTPAGNLAGDDPSMIEPLEIPEPARIQLNQIAAQGVMIDTAMDLLLRERRQAIAQRGTLIAVRVAISALLFGLLCISLLGLIYWRVATPVRNLTQTVEQISRGNLDARANVSGRDELALLASALNRMLDRRSANEARLQQYRVLVEGSRDLMAIADANYRYVMVNTAYAQVFARDRAEIEGAHVWEILGQTYFAEVVKAKLDRCLAGHNERFETERKDLSGQPRQLLARYFPIAAQTPSQRQVVAVLTDITELNQVETELREQSYLLDIAGRVGRLGGWQIDLETNRVHWSRIVAEIHGMPEGFAPSLDQGIALFAPEDRETIARVFSACAEQGIPYQEELRIIDASGETRWVRTSGEAVRDERGCINVVQGAFQDISAQKAAEHKAAAASERLRKTLESITDGFFSLDRDWRFVYLNNEAARLLQQPRAALIGENFWSRFPEAIGTRLERAYRQAMLAQKTVAFEEYYRPFKTWFEIRAFPSKEGLAVYFQDVSERHQMLLRLQSQKAALRQSRDRLAELVRTRKALIDSLPAHIALLDADGRIIEVNDTWRRFAEHNDFPNAGAGLGMNYLRVCQQAVGDFSDEAPIIARDLQALLAGERDSFSLEYPCHAPHEQRWFRMAANLLRETGEETETEPGRRNSAVVMHVDITERKLAELQLSKLAYRDRLTNLLNRHGFINALTARLAEEDRHAASMVVVSSDIRDLRDVNDSHGFDAGDQLLIEIARRLEQQVGKDGLVGRIAGDEFSIVLRGEPGLEPSQQVEAISAITEQPFLLPKIGIKIAINIGYTLVGDQQCSAEDLLHQAELALFQQRQYDTPMAIAYNAELDARVYERIGLTQDLRAALGGNQFELHFQPKVDLASGAVVACEALLRWNHPTRGLLPPGVFIQIAEQSQLIISMGAWALDDACRQLREWQAAGLSVVGMAVNVSLIQFRTAEFVHRVRDTLDSYQIAPSALTLEITESVFEEASDGLLAQLNALREIGIRLSLDDFGTGYSSLAYLQRYPFDEIKVDRSFVARVLEDRYSRTVLQAVKGIADALGADLIAEGIESDAVRKALLELGYERGQGYFFAMPLETEDFRWLLEQGSRLPLQTRGDDTADASTPPSTNPDRSETSA